MKTERFYLNNEHTAWIDSYLIDQRISSTAMKIWPAMIIVPGGAYLKIARREGESIALQYLQYGYSCFVLHYTPYLKSEDQIFSQNPEFNQDGRYPNPELYLMTTIHMIRSHAMEWGIDPMRVFATGFSAGGHIIATVATRWHDPSLISRLGFIPLENELKLSGCVLGYPMLSGDNHNAFMINRKNPQIQKMAILVDYALYGHYGPSKKEIEELDVIKYVSKDTSPMMIWHMVDDMIIPSIDSTRMILAMQKADVQCEYHLFRSAPHGIATAKEQYSCYDNDIQPHVATWITEAYYWLKEISEEK